MRKLLAAMLLVMGLSAVAFALQTMGAMRRLELAAVSSSPPRGQTRKIALTVAQ